MLMLTEFDAAILFIIATLTALYIRSMYAKKPVMPVERIANRKPSILNKLEELNDDKLVILFYGSQTGTAEDLAQRTL